VINRDESLIVVSENEKDTAKVQKILSDNALELKVVQFDNNNDLIKEIIRKFYSLIILVFNGYDEEKFKIISRIRRVNPKIGIIIITSKITKAVSLTALNNSVYSLIKAEDIAETLIPTLIFFYKTLNRKELAKEVIRFIKNVKLEYVIPNSLKYISMLTDHLVRDLTVIGLVNSKKAGEVRIGLQEIIINAIEHGNLEISFGEKSKFLEKGEDIEEVIEKYSIKDEFRERKVTIKYQLTDKKAVYRISDEGRGFDWQYHMETIDHEKNVLLEHGRGIFLALKYFDKVSFNKKGNEVVLEVHKH